MFSAYERSLAPGWRAVAQPPAWGCDDSGQWPQRFPRESTPETDEWERTAFPSPAAARQAPRLTATHASAIARCNQEAAARHRIGRYQIENPIGEGQYAQVYRGFDPILDRPVAIKLPRPGVLPLEKMNARFLGEARALARLRHPAIIPVFELGFDRNHCFIAMGLVEGQSLEQLRQNQPRFMNPHRAATIVASLAEVLDHVHSQGILHRDVKPANVLIDARGSVYLSDFGIAHGPDSPESPQDPETLLGTPAYTAPEQACGNPPPILPASDQYSLGVLFYELLSGRTPFSGPPLYVLFQAMNQHPISPRAIDPSIPAALADICLKALSRSPEDRYRSCRHLAESLRAWLTEPTKSLQSQAARSKSRRPTSP